MNRLAGHFTGNSRLGKLKRILKSILLGATAYDMVQEAVKMKSYVEQALMAVSIGDMLGIPIISYYRLRLLPHWVPLIQSWKTTVLKERDIIDKIVS